MPLPQAVHIDRPLTMFSIAYAATINMVSRQLAPDVPVTKQSDIYWVFDQGDWNRDSSSIRAPGAEPEFGDYDLATAGPYFCRERVQAASVNDEDVANADEGLQLEQSAVEFCTRKVYLGDEVWFANNIITAGKWSGIADKVGGTDFTKWSSPVSTPAADVQGWSDSINDATNGHRPNTMVIGQNVATALYSNPDVQDRVKYVTGALPSQIDEALLARYFRVGRVIVGDLPVTTSKKGATLTNAQQFSGKVWLGYIPPGGVTNRRQVSALKNFVWTAAMPGMDGQSMGWGVRRWRVESSRKTAVQASLFRDTKITAANAGGYASSAV